MIVRNKDHHKHQVHLGQILPPNQLLKEKKTTLGFQISLGFGVMKKGL